MINIKPLRNQVLMFKGIIEGKDFINRKNCETPLIHLEDLDSAVEWLRLKLMVIIEDEHNEEDINDIIIKAFPDLSTLPDGNFAIAKDYNSD